ncbi:MAG: sigma-70 family RNA polymerase sigma factor [Oscillospiraceae bacterium]|nr:sigma-70 family RNA polymerase sigma factor [Clostridia bacterium]MBQ9168644.1 sigma-70 family RNA polymerase sigma factor [Oscillospiraceae bacterium]
MSIFHREISDAQREQELIQLMAQHKTQLMRMAYMYLGDLALAEEAVQDTFLKAYAHLDRFRGDSSKETWLTRIAINTCKDIRRTAWFRNRKNTTSFDAIPECWENDTYSDDTVLQAVMSLSDKDKQVILLRYYQDMTVPEVAHVLSISVSSAASRLNRAKGHLRNMLKGWYFDEE